MSMHALQSVAKLNKDDAVYQDVKVFCGGAAQAFGLRQKMTN
jgi:hypothetical protein